MIKIFLTKGAPASGKSTWAKAEIAKDPLNYLRINNDNLRDSFNGSVFSSDYEKLIRETRNFLIKEGIKRGLNIILDNVNANKRNWEEVCKIAQESNKDIQVLEKLFYVELDELLERNAKREGTARVPDDIVKKFWKDLGGKQFKFSNAKVEIFTRRDKAIDRVIEPMKQDKNKERAIICDLDGSIAEISHRSPYNAALCLNDTPHAHVVEAVRLFHKNGYKVIFCSGREDEFRDLTEQWLNTHVGIDYELFMRSSKDLRKDSIIKEEIFEAHIKDKYYVRAVIDDRLQVCQLWFRLGLPLFRVGDPSSSF